MHATEIQLKPEREIPKPDFRAPKHPPLKDGWIRVILIPTFGVVVPHATGYFGPVTPGQPMYWVGLVWACFISFVLWHGNRFFLLQQRLHYDWFQQPLRKIIVLLFAGIFYTAPCSVVLMLAWYKMAGFAPDWRVIQTVTLSNVVCVLFITHVYETVYLIQQRESDLLAMERSERARTQSELSALKAQVAPHFLFNSLNTLSWLIENSPKRAIEFNQNLADVYRYILAARQKELVSLEEELEFLRQYCSLLQIRFEDSLTVELPQLEEYSSRWYLPPISLQVLVENAVKHNERPLRICVRLDREYVVVENRKQPLTLPPASSGLGLGVLQERCRLALGRDLEIDETPATFRVSVPVRTV